MQKEIDIENVLRSELRNLLIPMIPAFFEEVRQEILNRLDIEMERNPPITEKTAWEILMSYPCLDMPFLTKEYVLSLLSKQGLIHPSDLQRFLLNWARNGRIELHGEHIVFTQEGASESIPTPLAGSKERMNDDFDREDVRERVMLLLENLPTRTETSIMIKNQVAPGMDARKFRRVLHGLQRDGMVLLENMSGLPLMVTIV